MTFNQGLTITGLVLLALVALMVAYYFAMNRQTTTDTMAFGTLPHEHNTDRLVVLESVDFNYNPPRFQLHVQAPRAFSERPENLVLTDKTTNTPLMDLPLQASEYPNECITHHHLHDTVVKWNTEWFTIPAYAQLDASYDSKLNERLMTVIHNRVGGVSGVDFRNEEIDGVCFHVSEAIPTSPTPGDAEE